MKAIKITNMYEAEKIENQVMNEQQLYLDCQSGIDKLKSAKRMLESGEYTQQQIDKKLSGARKQFYSVCSQTKAYYSSINLRYVRQASQLVFDHFKGEVDLGNY